MPLSRREFVFASGGVATNVAILGSSTVMASAQEATRMKLASIRADVVVAGGGLAGACAAIAAGRNGASVVLIQDRS
jgi:NADPH-dependent 2,4-dienoyl-CoA reductase/sulfur reductase-like enzyme